MKKSIDQTSHFRTYCFYRHYFNEVLRRKALRTRCPKTFELFSLLPPKLFTHKHIRFDDKIFPQNFLRTVNRKCPTPPHLGVESLLSLISPRNPFSVSVFLPSLPIPYVVVVSLPSSLFPIHTHKMDKLTTYAPPLSPPPVGGREDGNFFFENY